MPDGSRPPRTVPTSKDRLKLEATQVARPSVDASFLFAVSDSPLTWCSRPRFVDIPNDAFLEDDLAGSCEEGCHDFEKHNPDVVAPWKAAQPIINLFTTFAAAETWHSEFDAAFIELLPKLFSQPFQTVAVMIDGDTTLIGELTDFDVVGFRRSVDKGRELRHAGNAGSRVSVSKVRQFRDREPGSPTMNPETALADIAADLRTLAELTTATLSKMNGVLEKVSEVIGATHASLLTDEERTVFETISRIPGTDAKAKKRVATEIAKLNTRPLSKALVAAVKEVLDARGWGVRCPTCGVPSTLIRRSDDRIQFSHTGPKGRSVTHGMEADLSTITLVDRPRKGPRRKK